MYLTAEIITRDNQIMLELRIRYSKLYFSKFLNVNILVTDYQKIFSDCEER